MGKKEKQASKKINVEIAPGNQAAMDRFIELYNHQPDRKTSKIKYTDVVNEALDRLFRTRRPAPKSKAGESK